MTAARALDAVAQLFDGAAILEEDLADVEDALATLRRVATLLPADAALDTRDPLVALHEDVLGYARARRIPGTVQADLRRGVYCVTIVIGGKDVAEGMGRDLAKAVRAAHADFSRWLRDSDLSGALEASIDQARAPRFAVARRAI